MLREHQVQRSASVSATAISMRLFIVFGFCGIAIKRADYELLTKMPRTRYPIYHTSMIDDTDIRGIEL